MIYCIGNRNEAVCKIGYTGNLKNRLNTLQTGSHFPLEVLFCGDGPRELEKEIHAQFDFYRLKGEWFQISQAIASYFKFDSEPDPKFFSFFLMAETCHNGELVREKVSGNCTVYTRKEAIAYGMTGLGDNLNLIIADAWEITADEMTDFIHHPILTSFQSNEA